MLEAEQVLDFWFGELDANGLAEADRRKRWFAGKATDEAIANQFGSLVERALNRELDEWAADTHSLVALVTLLDQFPRNIYRSSERAFSGDARACQFVNAAIAAGTDRLMPMCQRAMFYMPLEHAEDLTAQNLCVVLLEGMLRDAVDPCHDYLQGCVQWARQHRDIVAQFGRFPHRNQVLARESSAAEAAWMAAGGQSFGQ